MRARDFAGRGAAQFVAVGPLAMKSAISSSSRFSTCAGSTPGFTVAWTVNRPTRWNGCSPPTPTPPASRRGPAHCRAASWQGRRAPSRRGRARRSACRAGPGPPSAAEITTAATRSFITIVLPLAASARRAMRRHVHRAALDRAEILLDQRPRFGGVDVAGQHQHRIVGAVIVAEPLLHVGQAGGVEVGHRADRRVVIRVAGREQVAEHSY
jgi:hypothetical protein